MSKTIGTMSIQSDENGLITLQCDRCKTRFKVECSFMNDECEGSICCPSCGMTDSVNTFWPEEIIEGAKSAAIMEAELLIQEAFKGLNSKYIKFKSTPVKRVDTKLSYKNKDYDMRELTVNCCQKRIALMPLDLTAGYYCPYCGRIEK